MSSSKTTTTKTNKKPTSYYIFSLPTFGSPYIVKTIEPTTRDSLDALQTLVRGMIEPISSKSFQIHPMFCRNDKRWNALRQFLTCKWVKVYVNENGSNECCVNMATIKSVPSGHCPHLWGDVAVVVPCDTLKILGYNPDSFTPIFPPDHDPEDYPCWEFDDDEDIEKQKAEWSASAPGFDFSESNGFCYKSGL